MLVDKKVSLVTTTVKINECLVVVDKFTIAIPEGVCTEEQDWEILNEFVQMAAGNRVAGGWSPVLKDRPKKCSLIFSLNASDTLKKCIKLEARKYYKILL
ncbi:MAG: hypothetical protein WCJ51_01935 [Candidatus Moraniibacteriota bacterium]